jgi:hypothetical protein
MIGTIVLYEFAVNVSTNNAVPRRHPKGGAGQAGQGRGRWKLSTPRIRSRPAGQFQIVCPDCDLPHMPHRRITNWMRLYEFIETVARSVGMKAERPKSCKTL